MISAAWEERLWRLTHDLSVRMADRCQPGLCGHEEFANEVGRTVRAIATEHCYTVGTKQRPMTAQEQADLFAKLKPEFSK